MNRVKSTVLALLASIIAVSGFLMPLQASAQGSAALSIVPKKNYTVEAGKSVNDTLLIRNQDREKALGLTLRVVDFTYLDDTGAPKLNLDENAPQTTWSLKPFLKVPEKVTIDPGESKTIDLEVSIPSNQGAGSYYSAIVYSTSAADGANVGLSASGVTLAFVNIPGEVDENLTLERLGAYKNSGEASGSGYAFATTTMPHQIAYTLKNEGNVAESPVGSITLKPLIGKEITIENINPQGSLALIGQTRTFVSCIKLTGQEVDFEGSRTEATTCADPGLWPGYYKVEMAAYYGQNGNNTRDLVGTGGFWYLPWWFVIIVAAIVLFVAYRIWRIVRYIRQKQSGGAAKRAPRRRK